MSSRYHLFQGGIRSAPSKRMTLPLSMGFVSIVPTREPNSCGSPNRDGSGTEAPSSACTAGGSPSNRGVRNSPGACRENESFQTTVSTRREVCSIYSFETFEELICFNLALTMVITRMPTEARSLAMGSVMPTMAPFDAEYAT